MHTIAALASAILVCIIQPIFMRKTCLPVVGLLVFAQFYLVCCTDATVQGKREREGGGGGRERESE